MDLGLTGKVAIVTGASRGIGLAVTRTLVEEGAQVVAGARSVTGDLASLAAAGSVHPVEVDLTTEDGPGRLVDAAVTTYGGLDVLVNNVGGAHARPGGFLTVTDEEWTASLTVNLLAAVRTTRLALPHLLERAAATIVIDLLGQRVPARPARHRLQRGQGGAGQLLQVPVQGARTAGRPGQHGQPRPGGDRPLAGRGRGRRAPSPGPAAGPGRDRRAGGRAGSVTGRFSTPQEVADLVVLLASGRAGNITGADFVIDGGLVQTL